jgi:hypothetical protein
LPNRTNGRASGRAFADQARQQATHDLQVIQTCLDVGESLPGDAACVAARRFAGRQQFADLVQAEA